MVWFWVYLHGNGTCNVRTAHTTNLPWTMATTAEVDLFWTFETRFWTNQLQSASCSSAGFTWHIESPADGMCCSPRLRLGDEYRYGHRYGHGADSGAVVHPKNGASLSAGLVACTLKLHLWTSRVVVTERTTTAGEPSRVSSVGRAT